MNKERLLKLAEHLETVKEENFNLDIWSCGTSGCAVGHACTIPEFNEAGLKLDGPYPVYSLGIERGEVTGWPAVEEFFELSQSKANYLFSTFAYPDGGRTTPAEVADRIREYIERHEVKTSKALKLTLKHLWDGRGLYYPDTPKQRFCCCAAQQAGEEVSRKVIPILEYLLDGYCYLESWLRGKKKIKTAFLNKNQVRMQATRKAWLEHLIAHYESLGD